jgi:hypothetical protein
MQIRAIGSNQTEAETSDGTRVLVSYATPVAAYIVGRGYVRSSEHYSKTTTGHINKWLDGAKCEIVSPAEIKGLV